MASAGLGTLTLDLVAKIAGFEGPMDKAARTTERRMKEIERSVSNGIKGVLKSFAAFGAGFLSVQAIFQGFGNAIDQADKLNDFTKRLGVSAETISAWGYAASQTGTDIDSLGKGLKLLQKNMAEALDPKSTQSNLFKSLGISVKDAEGNLRELEDVVPEVANAFKTLDNDATETALSMQLFGKSGSDLLEFLNQGGDGLDDFREKAEELGIVLSQETLSAADDFNDAIGDLKTATQGAMYQALEPILPVLREFIGQMVDFARTGEGAKKAGEEAASGIRMIGDIAGKTYTFLLNLREGLAAFEQQARGYTTLVLGGGANSLAQIEESAKRLNAVFDGSFTGPKTGADKQDPIDSRLKVDFKSLDQQEKDISEAAKQREKLQNAVNKYLGNPTGRTPKGKSDAEKEAEQIAKAIRQMADAQREWQNELNENGNPIAKEYADRLAEITDRAEKFTQDGVPADKVKAFVEQMKELASSIQSKELAEFQKEFANETLSMAAAFEGPGVAALVAYTREVEALDKQLKNGLITQQQYEERISAMHTPYEELIRDLHEEGLMLGMTSEQQEIYNNLKMAGVDASTELGQAVIQQTRDLQAYRAALEDQIELLDGARDASRGFFQDLYEGKGVVDSLKDALGRLADAIFQWASSGVTDMLFGKQGSPQGGSAGGWIGSLISGFFGGSGGASQPTYESIWNAFGGGSFASGGYPRPWTMNRVNERGPELLTVGGKDFLMMGSQGGKVTPNHQLGGSPSFVFNNNNNYAAPTSSKTQNQQAAKTGYEIRRNSRLVGAIAR